LNKGWKDFWRGNISVIGDQLWKEEILQCQIIYLVLISTLPNSLFSPIFLLLSFGRFIFKNFFSKLDESWKWTELPFQNLTNAENDLHICLYQEIITLHLLNLSYIDVPLPKANKYHSICFLSSIFLSFPERNPFFHLELGVRCFSSEIFSHFNYSIVLS
jgi:hypothetical protein